MFSVLAVVCVSCSVHVLCICCLVCYALPPCFVSSIQHFHQDQVRCEHCRHLWIMNSSSYTVGSRIDSNSYNLPGHIDPSSGLPSGLLAIENNPAI